MEITENYIIGNKTIKVLTHKNITPITELKFIVIHYTASTNLVSTVNFLQSPKNKVSAHVVIGRMGEVFQLVPFNIQAWHAGKSEYKGCKNLNHYSIGIELLNAGKLERRDNKFYTYYGEEIPRKQVVSCINEDEGLTFWQAFSTEQIKKLISLCRALKKQYPQIKEIIGHSDITSRKIDPGKAFPWDKIQHIPFLEGS